MSTAAWEERFLEVWDTPLPLTGSEEARRAHVGLCQELTHDLKAEVATRIADLERAEHAVRSAETHARDWDRKAGLAERAGELALRDEARAAGAAARHEAEALRAHAAERRAWAGAFRVALRAMHDRVRAVQESLPSRFPRHPRRAPPPDATTSPNAFATFDQLAGSDPAPPVEWPRAIGPWVHRFDDGKPRMAILSLVDDEVWIEVRPVDDAAAPHESMGGSQPLAEVLARPHPMWDQFPHARLLVRVAVYERDAAG